MRIVIVAGDPFAPQSDEADVHEHLDAMHREVPISEVVCNERPGIDDFASSWCKRLDIENRIYSHGDNTILHVARPLSFILMHEYAVKRREEGNEVLALIFGRRGGVSDLVRKLQRDGFSVRVMERTA